jgi:hypothetical protein
MAEAGTQMSPVADPTAVTVTNGIPSPNPVTITNGGQVLFSNADNIRYMLEFWTKGNDKHPAVSVVLPANGTVLVQANSGANDQNTVCNYNVLLPSGEAVGGPTDTGGGNTIRIGSGMDDDDSQN